LLNGQYPPVKHQYLAIKSGVLNFTSWYKGSLLALTLALLACASAPPAGPAPALQTAQHLEQRAAQAFAHGDRAAALASYQAASNVYASLALTEQLVLAQLSIARVQSEMGLADNGKVQALKTIAWVLAQITANPTLPVSTQLLAYGRAAALQLGRDPVAANQHLQQAFNLCQASCPQLAALQVLQSRWTLQQGMADAALAASTAALQTATAAQSMAEQANARRVRARAALALQQPRAAADDAQISLVLDQTLGLATRVQEDLQLLVAASQALGDTAQAQRYQGLWDQAMKTEE
jgi:hypothetical protein